MHSSPLDARFQFRRDDGSTGQRELLQNRALTSSAVVEKPCLERSSPKGGLRSDGKGRASESGEVP
jgi:hypothetical protein